MRATFFDPRAPYHALRRAFVRKEPVAATPPHLVRTVPAGHRRTPDPVTALAVQDSAPAAGPCYEEG